MLFSKRFGKSVKVSGGEDGESRRHTFWRRVLPLRFSMLRSLSSSALSSAKSSSAGQLLPAEFLAAYLNIAFHLRVLEFEVVLKLVHVHQGSDGDAILR
jgi:hypothetical protein